MSEFVGVVKLAAVLGTVLVVVLVVLLSLPHSKLRDFLMPIVGWGFALLCALYTISPVDLMPEAFLGPLGLGDDLVAVVAGVGSAVAATRAGKRFLHN